MNRPPLNLLRQELAGTCIYMDILQKTTETIDIHKEEDDKLEGIAEEKLVSFCEQVLREASDFQSSMEETTNMDIHRVLELRSPIIIKVQLISWKNMHVGIWLLVFHFFSFGWEEEDKNSWCLLIFYF